MTSVEKKPKELTKTLVQEIINLDDSNNLVPPIEQQLFISDLAYQCGNLLNWVADTKSQLFAETLWKNSMRIKAVQKFQELDADQIRKLVDRDWRVMNEENKKAVYTTFSHVENAGDLQSRAESLRDKIQREKQKKRTS